MERTWGGGFYSPMQFWITCCILVSSLFSEVRQIDPVIALLPWTHPDLYDHRVNFTLQAYGGCFRWVTERADIVKVFPLAEDGFPSSGSGLSTDEDEEGRSRCYEQVVVSQQVPVLPPETSRERARVSAVDVDNRTELHCEVHVARIHRLVIETTARKINVDAVETLRARAYDAEGNVFSCLEGVRFWWTVENRNVLTSAPLETDIYRSTAVRRRIDQQGQQSDLLLVKGVLSGRTKIKLQLAERGYETVSPAFVELDVSESLSVEPSSIYVPPSAVVNFAVRILKPYGAASPLVRMPATQFSWQSGNTEVVHADSKTGKSQVLLSSPGAVGSSKITVVDSRTANNTAEALLTVADPSHIHVTVRDLLRFATDADHEILLHTQLATNAFSPPYTNLPRILARKQVAALEDWDASFHLPFARLSPPGERSSSRVPSRSPLGTTYLVKGRIYLVRPALFADDIQLYLSSNSALVPTCTTSTVGSTPSQGCLLDAMWSAPNRHAIVYRANDLGSGEVTFTLEKVVGVAPVKDFVKNTPQVRGVLQFHVVDPITMQWLPVAQQGPLGGQISSSPIALPPLHEWTLQPRGGSGQYSWHSSDPKIVSIIDGSRIRAGSTTGVAQISVSDRMNAENKFVVDVVVGRVSELLFFSERHTLALNDTLRLPVGAKTNLPEQTPLSLFPHWLGPDMDPRFLHFVNCTALTAASAPLAVLARESEVRLRIRTVDPVLSVQQLPLNELRHTQPEMKQFACGVVTVVPQAPGRGRILAVLDAVEPSISSLNAKRVPIALTTLEVYERTRIELPQPRISFARSPSVPRCIRSSSQVVASGTTGMSVCKFDPAAQARRVSHVAVVGGWIDIKVVGGPSFLSVATVEEVFETPEDNTIHVEILKHSPFFPDEVGSFFRVTCLKERMTVPVTYRVRFKGETAKVHMEDSNAFEDVATFDIGCAMPMVAEIIANDPHGLAVRQIPVGQDGKPFPPSAETIARCGAVHEWALIAWDKFGRQVTGLGGLHMKWESDSSFLEKYPEAWGPLSAVDSGDADGTNTVVRLPLGRHPCHGSGTIRAWISVGTHGEATPMMTKRLPRESRDVLVASYKEISPAITKGTLSPHWQRSVDGLWALGNAISVTVAANVLPLGMSSSVCSQRPRLDLFFHPGFAARLVTVFGSGQAVLSVSDASEASREWPLPRAHVALSKPLSRHPPTEIPVSMQGPFDPKLPIDLRTVISPPRELSRECAALLQNLRGFLDVFAGQKERDYLVLARNASPSADFDVNPFTADNPASMQEMWIRGDSVAETQYVLEDHYLLGSVPVPVAVSMRPIGRLQLDLFADSRRIASSSPDETGVYVQIEQFTSHRLVALAFDSADHALEPFHYSAMQLDVLVDDPVGIRVESSEQGNFVVQGMQPGAYKIQVTAVNYPDRRVASPAVHIMVYRPLQVVPPRLVLLPDGHSYELSVVGGPSGVVTSFSVDDEKVAKMSDIVAGQIISANAGKTIVTVQMKDPAAAEGGPALGNREIEVKIPVTVALPSRAIVTDGSRPVDAAVALSPEISKRMIVQLVTGSGEHFTVDHLHLPSGPDTRQPAAGGYQSSEGTPCRYSWASANRRVVYFEEASDASNIAGSGLHAVTLRGGEPGDAELTMKVKCGSSWARLSDSKTIQIAVRDNVAHPMLPLVASRTAGHKTQHTVSRVIDLFRGEVLRVLPSSKYEIKPSFKRWRFVHGSENEDRAATEKCVQARRSGDSLLLLTAASAPLGCISWAVVIDEDSSVPMHLPMELVQLHSIQIEGLREFNMDGGAEGAPPRVILNPGEEHTFTVALYDSQNNRVAVPSNLPLGVHSSHHSLVSISAVSPGRETAALTTVEIQEQGNFQVLTLPAGTFVVRGSKVYTGCATVSAATRDPSEGWDGAMLPLWMTPQSSFDVMMVCVSAPEEAPPTRANVTRLEFPGSPLAEDVLMLERIKAMVLGMVAVAIMIILCYIFLGGGGGSVESADHSPEYKHAFDTPTKRTPHRPGCGLPSSPLDRSNMRVGGIDNPFPHNSAPPTTTNHSSSRDATRDDGYSPSTVIMPSFPSPTNPVRRRMF